MKLFNQHDTTTFLVDNICDVSVVIVLSLLLIFNP